MGYKLGMNWANIEDVAELYRECIRQGKTWQELLNVVGYRFDEIPEE